MSTEIPESTKARADNLWRNLPFIPGNLYGNILAALCAEREEVTRSFDAVVMTNDESSEILADVRIERDSLRVENAWLREALKRLANNNWCYPNEFRDCASEALNHESTGDEICATSQERNENSDIPKSASNAAPQQSDPVAVAAIAHDKLAGDLHELFKADLAKREKADVRIYTRCPACGNDALTINEDKHLLCTWIKCPNPTLIDTGPQPPIATDARRVKFCPHCNTVMLPTGSGSVYCPNDNCRGKKDASAATPETSDVPETDEAVRRAKESFGEQQFDDLRDHANKLERARDAALSQIDRLQRKESE